MLLKRSYNKPKDWKPQRNARDAEGKLPRPDKPEGALLNPPPVAHVKVLRAGDRQNFSATLVEDGVRDGWIALGGGELAIKTDTGVLRYRIVRTPGHYCVLCPPPGERLDGQEEARAHVAGAHKDYARPSVAPRRSGLAKDDAGQRLAQNPAGYERIHHYECERVQ
jgi:hypothetical protein